MLGFTLALTAIVVSVLAMSRTNQDSVQEMRLSGCLGSAEEAFHVASNAVASYISAMDGEPFRIDPQFRATLHSQSKIWTVKGYALCPRNGHKAYRWTVILNCHPMQEWEILAKIVTPEIPIGETSQIDGPSKAQGKLLSVD